MYRFSEFHKLCKDLFYYSHKSFYFFFLHLYWIQLLFTKLKYSMNRKEYPAWQTPQVNMRQN